MGQLSSILTIPEDVRFKAADNALELRRVYHGLARTLEEGAPMRPGLPIELVIYILRLADCVLPSPRLTVATDTPCHARATSGAISRTIWFSTPIISHEVLSRVARMQLHTLSRDQGWCSDPNSGSYSWFEIAIVSTGDQDGPVLKKNPSGEGFVWISHYNLIASQEFSRLNGTVFGSDHDIWKHLAEGDRVEVRACAQYSSWSNNGKKAVLSVDEWFEPTLPPRTG